MSGSVGLSPLNFAWIKPHKKSGDGYPKQLFYSVLKLYEELKKTKWNEIQIESIFEKAKDQQSNQYSIQKTRSPKQKLQFSSVQLLSRVRLRNPWTAPTISSSVVPFSSHHQSFPAAGSFLVSQFFTSGGQSIGVSVSASVLPMNSQDWFPLG